MTGIIQGLLASIGSAVASAASDAYFNLVTLLLNTTSTNGAQNNTFLDSSTNNFSITRNGNTTQGTFTPFSQTGWSGYFDGASDYIQFTNSDFSVSTGDFTAEWFMFITSDKAQVGIMTAATNSNLTIGYGSGSANARQPYVEWGGAGAYIGTMSNYMNTWVHICVMRSSGTVYTFQNGTLLSSASKSASVGATTNMVIGTNAGDIAGQGVPGYLSNVRFATSAIYSTSGFTAPTLPLTRTSQSATNVQFLTLQSNRFLDSNGVNTPASSPLAITTYNDVSVQAFSPFLPTAAYDTAVVGGSGYFDGSGDYLTAASNSAFAFGTGSFTWETWFYSTGAVSRDVCFYDLGSGNTTGGFAVFTTGSTLYVRIDGANDLTYSLSTISSAWLNSWHHLAVVRNGTTLTIYLDGVSVASGTRAQNVTQSSPYIGNGAGVFAGYPLLGYLSGMRVVKGTAVYTAAFTPPTAPLTAITNTSLLLSTTNAGIYDSAAKNVLETVGNAQVSTTQAKWGTTSMAFDGTGDTLNSSPSQVLSLGSGNWTIECWVRLNATGTETNIGQSKNYYTAGFNGNFVFRVGTSNLWRSFDGQSNQATIDGSFSWSTGVWYHVAWVRNSGTVTVYRDGTSLGSVSDSKTLSDSANGIILGSSLNAYIDDLRITVGLARYTTTFTPPTEAFPIQ